MASQGGRVKFGNKCINSYYEKDVCGTIDNGTSVYELTRVYTRDNDTGLINVHHYEYKNGTFVIGTVTETCCSCDAICEAQTVVLNRLCFGYSGSFNGDSQFPQEKALTGANIFIQYFEVDGNIIISTPTLIGNTGAATFSNTGYGIAYDSVINLLNASILGSNDLLFVPAGNVLVDRGWGVQYNDAKSYRLVISDSSPISGAIAYWTIVINPTERWDGIGNAYAGGFWTMVDFQNNIGSATNLAGCQLI